MMDSPQVWHTHTPRNPAATTEFIRAALDPNLHVAGAHTPTATVVQVSEYVDNADAPGVPGLHLLNELHVVEGDRVTISRGLVRHVPHRWATGAVRSITWSYTPAYAAPITVAIREVFARRYGNARRPPEITSRYCGDTLRVMYRGRRILTLQPGDVVHITAFNVTASRG